MWLDWPFGMLPRYKFGRIMTQRGENGGVGEEGSKPAVSQNAIVGANF